jgi:hypothetical protein
MRDEAERLAIMHGTPLLIALTAVGVRLLMKAERLTWIGFARSLFVGVFVGYLASMYLAETEYTEGVKGAILGALVIIAEDLVLALLSLARRFQEDPESYIRKFWRR